MQLCTDVHRCRKEFRKNDAFMKMFADVSPDYEPAGLYTVRAGQVESKAGILAGS